MAGTEGCSGTAGDLNGRSWIPSVSIRLAAGIFLCALAFMLAMSGRAAASESNAQAAESAAGASVKDIFAKVDAPDAQTMVAEVFEQVGLPQAAPAPLSKQEAAAHANGTLFLQKPTPAAGATFVGRGGYSADGISATLGANLRAEVAAGSTTVKAYLYGYFQTGTPTAAESTVNFDGTPVALTKLDDYSFGLLSSARADVTQQVAAKVSPLGGITNFAAATGLPLDGLALVVIYENPALPETTIAVFDGAAQMAGDTATFSFAAPLDKTVAGFGARMSLGIGFSYQQGSGHLCGPGSPVSMQHSAIDVNGSRVTTCAGGDDDTVTGGGLLTVGGVGDFVNNPADPLQKPGDGNPIRVQDDELYDIEPFLSQGDTSLVVKTSQPSNDDILFLSVVQVNAAARVTTEVCGDGIDNDGDGLTDGLDSEAGCPVVTNPPVVTVPPVVTAPPPGVGPVVPGVVVAPPPGVADPLRGVGPVRLEAPRTVERPKPAVKTLPRTGESPALAASAGLLFILVGFVLLRRSHAIGD